MDTKLVPKSVLNRLKRHTRTYQAARHVRMALGRVVKARQVDGLPGRVHFNDFMLDDDSAHGVATYRECALNVLRNVDATLEAAGRDVGDVRSWLDFGCGYGRVVRFLVQRTSPERVWVTDVIDDAVSFCADEFGVHPLRSRGSFSALELPRFDFVYMISVITHLNEENSMELLRRLPDWLEPGGIVMFTTHGEWSLANLGTYGQEYEDMRDTIEREVRDRGISFVPYHHYEGDDYGLTWHSAEALRETMRDLHGDSLRLLRFEPHGLDEHQDVFAYQRTE